MADKCISIYFAAATENIEIIKLQVQMEYKMELLFDSKTTQRSK